jgi:hypothetical protein
MSFLQPWLLWGLPLVAIPLVIHLLNQWRFQTMPWAAMMFLLAARRMTRGYSRLRQWLILAMRTLAVAGLVMAVSRPLLGGWMGGILGQQSDWTVILIDRSPSMQGASVAGGPTKLTLATRELVEILSRTGSKHWMVIDSVSLEPKEIESPAQLLRLASAGPATSTANIPRLCQRAYELLRDQQAGTSEIWIVSDRSSNDWEPASGLWEVVRESFAERSERTRFHLLAYPDPPKENLAVRVTSVRKQSGSSGSEVLVSIQLKRSLPASVPMTIPVEFEMEGARSVVSVDCAGPTAELVDHPIAIGGEKSRGWGRVTIPADSNEGDNSFSFVFEDPPAAKTLIVTEDDRLIWPARLAAGIGIHPSDQPSVEVVRPDQLTGLDASKVSLVVWHAPLREVKRTPMIEDLVAREGAVLFFPTRDIDGESVFGVRFVDWLPAKRRLVEHWRGEEDLLANGRSGSALSVGELEIDRVCGMEGEFTSLATLEGGVPLLARAPTRRGGAYFFTTTLAASDSSLARNGVVLFAAIQRALAEGRKSQGTAREVIAGELDGLDPSTWSAVATKGEAISTEVGHHAGIYRSEEGHLFGVVRSLDEDSSKGLSEENVSELFRGLSLRQMTGEMEPGSSVVQEIWRVFLLGMMVALVAEAVLSFPKSDKRRQSAP